MKVLKAGTLGGSTTLDLTSLGFTNKDDYSVKLHTSAYYTMANTGSTWGNGGIRYGYGKGAYVSAKTATSVTITITAGIAASYEILG